MIFVVWILHWQKELDNINSKTRENKLRTVRKRYKTALFKLAPSRSGPRLSGLQLH